MATHPVTTMIGNETSLILHVCNEFPPDVHSQGLTLGKDGLGMKFSLPMLEMQMTVIFVITQAFHFVLKNYLEIPKFTSQILAGIMLGPSLLGHRSLFDMKVFTIESQAVIDVLGQLGYGLFLFVTGAKMELELIRKTGHKALTSGILCVVVPLALGMFLQNRLQNYPFHLTEDQIAKLPVLTVLHCISPFSVIANLLENINLLSSEIGRLALSTSTVSDMFSICLRFTSRFAGMKRDKHLAITLAVAAAHILSLVFIFRPLMFWMIRQTPENRPVKKSYVNFLIVAVFLSGMVSHFYGQTFHFGLFAFGMAVPAGPPLGSALEEKFHVFVFEVLLPVFVTSAAMRADFFAVDLKDPATTLNTILLCFCFVVKVISTMAAPLYCKMPLTDAFVLALILSYKGVVQLWCYALARDDQSASDSVFGMMFIGVAVNATLVPIVVKYLYDPSKKYAGYQRRDIMHLKPNDELRIVACIHSSSNIPSVINILDAACPTKENPIAIYVLHLIELIGRTSPAFISHQKQKKTVATGSYSDNVIVYFNTFVRENIGAVNLSTFTAISPPKYMPEDTCSLALDKLASLILLPFHRKWAIDGSIESEDNAIRMLNRSVLDKAPCSIGILVDRGHLGRATPAVAHRSLFSVAVVFLGGKDDREALAFAKRMSNDSRVSLTVIRLVSMNQTGSDWDKVLDTEMLKEFRYSQMNHHGGIVTYIEEMVKDGPQTALTLRSMVDEYSLVIVGRRYNVESPQTAGLSEWTEFPELGTLGDLLASPDVSCRASILIVKQQQQAS